MDKKEDIDTDRTVLVISTLFWTLTEALQDKNEPCKINKQAYVSNFLSN